MAIAAFGLQCELLRQLVLSVTSNIQLQAMLMNDPSPYQSSEMTPQSHLRPTGGGEAIGEGQIALAWFLFVVVATIGGAVAGAIGGMVIGAVLGGAGQSMQTIQVASAFAGFFAGLPVSWLTFRWQVRRLLAKASALSVQQL